MMRSASRRGSPDRGSSARSGPAFSSRKSNMVADSIKVSPSACTNAGTRPKGLNWRISSKSLPTDQLRCSKGTCNKFMLTATRRTKGESNIPIKIILVATFHPQSGSRQSLRQLHFDARRLAALDELQMHSRPCQHFDPSFQDAASRADARLMLIE